MQNCVCLLLVSVFWLEVSGSGRLLDPPSRSSLWRFKNSDPALAPHRKRIQANYDDMNLNCGGRRTLIATKGKCGLCGDPYTSPKKENEGGGKYDLGIVTRRYRVGELIPIAVEITADRRGYFEFRLCPHGENQTLLTQDCFNRFPLLFSTGYPKWQLPENPQLATGTHKLGLKLPRGVSCEHCVLQWRYRAGNAWGVENGKKGLGLGQQSEFYGCADISIKENNNSGAQNTAKEIKKTEVFSKKIGSTDIAGSATVVKSQKVISAQASASAHTDLSNMKDASRTIVAAANAQTATGLSIPVAETNAVAEAKVVVAVAGPAVDAKRVTETTADATANVQSSAVASASLNKNVVADTKSVASVKSGANSVAKSNINANSKAMVNAKASTNSKSDAEIKFLVAEKSAPDSKAVASAQVNGNTVGVRKSTVETKSRAVANAKSSTEIKSVEKRIAGSKAVESITANENTVEEKGGRTDNETETIVDAATSARVVTDAKARAEQTISTDTQLRIVKERLNVNSVAKASTSLKMSANDGKVQKKNASLTSSTLTQAITTTVKTSQSTTLKRVKSKNEDAQIAFQQFGPVAQENSESKASFVMLCVAFTHLPLLTLALLSFLF